MAKKKTKKSHHQLVVDLSKISYKYGRTVWDGEKLILQVSNDLKMWTNG